MPGRKNESIAIAPQGLADYAEDGVSTESLLHPPCPLAFRGARCSLLNGIHGEAFYSVAVLFDETMFSSLLAGTLLGQPSPWQPHLVLILANSGCLDP